MASQVINPALIKEDHPYFSSSAINIMSHQKFLKCVVTEKSFQNAGTGTRITAKMFAGRKARHFFPSENNLPIFIFYAKAMKPTKSLLRLLLGSASAEDSTVAL
jgi:hypothetical protein